MTNEKKIRDQLHKGEKSETEFRDEIARKIIREYRGNPKEIIERCEIIENIIKDEKLPVDEKEIILKSVIRGYFTACKLFLQKYNETKFEFKRKEFEKRYINSLIKGLSVYNDYPNKSAFEVLLGDIDFKTGPLS